MALAVPVAGLFEGEKHSAHIADARRVPVSDASQLTLAKRGYERLALPGSSYKFEEEAPV